MIIMPNDISIEYAHIYTNNRIGDEQKLSLDILQKVKDEFAGKKISLVVMVDDYSFPDPSFSYEDFTQWLKEKGHSPDLTLRESQLIPCCDEVLGLIREHKLKEEISSYIKTKKYPCSLFVATWYLMRLGCITSPIFGETLSSEKLINILPLSFKPFEDKAFEIIKTTQFAHAVGNIDNRYFEGRVIE